MNIRSISKISKEIRIRGDMERLFFSQYKSSKQNLQESAIVLKGAKDL